MYLLYDQEKVLHTVYLSFFDFLHYKVGVKYYIPDDWRDRYIEILNEQGIGNPEMYENW